MRQPGRGEHAVEDVGGGTAEIEVRVGDDAAIGVELFVAYPLVANGRGPTDLVRIESGDAE
jgi:hypothetical protein